MLSPAIGVEGAIVGEGLMGVSPKPWVVETWIHLKSRTVIMNHEAVPKATIDLDDWRSLAEQ